MIVIAPFHRDNGTRDCTHPGAVEQSAYRVAMSQRYVVACRDCAAYLTSQGLTLIPTERRKRVEPVSVNRRRAVAAWVRGNLARVMDHGGTAA